MSGHKHKNRHIKISGLNFIILPIIFFCGIYLLGYVTLAPYFSPLVGAAGMFFSDSERDYSEKNSYDNIFVPIEENPTTVPVVQKADGKKYVEKKSFDFPTYSDCFGQLIIEDCGIDCKLFFGDGPVALRNGVGMYNGSFIPGYGGTTLIGGHNHTYFNGLQYAQEGQEVLIKTSYGNYTYRITGTAVRKFNDPDAFDLTSRDACRLVMYTCYPFNELGLTSQRFFVYAEMTEGMMIDSGRADG